MDVDPDSELDPLAWLVQDPPPKPPTVFVKKTLLSSPVILKFYPKFKVDTAKQWVGLPSKSINDEREQSLHPPEADSYFGDDMSEDDDDLLWQTENKQEGSDIEQDRKSKISTVNVVVKSGSVTSNGVEFSFSSGLRDAVLVPGVDENAEDSLLVSLKSGFLLLIRFYYMPKSCSDFNASQKKCSINDLLHVYKPFVVQWWKTTSPSPGSVPDMDTSGAILQSHEAGLAVVSASAANVLRVYMCNQTELGMELSPHHNVPLEGNILHVCIGSSGSAAEENLIQLLTLSFSHSGRLELNLFQWFISESLTNNARRSTLPLSANFALPIMIIPLAHNNSFLFVCPEEFIIVTHHNIISADYSFSRFGYAGSFPTSFAYPEPKSDSSSNDEIYLASDSGIVYSVVVSDNSTLTYRPILRIADSISVFTVQPSDTGFLIHYSNDAGGAKQLHIPELFSEEPKTSIDKIPYSDASLVLDYKNWAPIVDICITNAFETRTQVPYASQELWVVSGMGKRSKLANLSVAYPLRKNSKSYDALRKVEKLFYFSLPDARHIVFVSMPFETRLLEMDHEESSEGSSESEKLDDILSEVDSPAIITEEASLHVQMIPNASPPVFLQVASSSLTFTDLESSQSVKMEEKTILQACSSIEFLFLVTEQDGKAFLEVVRPVAPNFHEAFDPKGFLVSVYSRELSFDSSCIYAVNNEDGGGMLYMGTFNEHIVVSKFSSEGEFSFQDSIDIDLATLGIQKDVFPRDLLVPASFHWMSTTKELMAGTSTGICLRFSFESNTLSLIHHLRLGTTPISFTPLADTMVLACLRNVWLFDFEESTYPTKVSFDEKVAHPINSVVKVDSKESGYRKLLLVRDDGVTTASIFLHKTPMLKQITIGEPAKRLAYLENLKAFVLLCKSRDPLNRLRFVDRKTLKVLPCLELHTKSGEERDSPIFEATEFPICAFQWEVERNDRVSKKLVVGCSVNGSKGSIKIIDYSKFSVKNSSSSGVRITELYTIPRDESVSCIAQIGSTIFFASESSIFTTSYLLSERKLRPVNTIMNLSSGIASMTSETAGGDNKLIVSTKMDSVFVFEYHPGDSFTAEELKLVQSDKTPRSLANHVKIEDSLFIADKLHCNIEEVPLAGNTRKTNVYKTQSIPRLFRSSAQGPWSRQLDSLHMISVGVSGEVIAFDRLEIGSEEMNRICQKLAEDGRIPVGASFDVLYERLERPFLYKVTGKAFQGIHKPFFGGFSSPNVIDYDLEELKGAAASSICL